MADKYGTWMYNKSKAWATAASLFKFPRLGSDFNDLDASLMVAQELCEGLTQEDWKVPVDMLALVLKREDVKQQLRDTGYAVSDDRIALLTMAAAQAGVKLYLERVSPSFSIVEVL